MFFIVLSLVHRSRSLKCTFFWNDCKQPKQHIFRSKHRSRTNECVCVCNCRHKYYTHAHSINFLISPLAMQLKHEKPVWHQVKCNKLNSLSNAHTFHRCRAQGHEKGSSVAAVAHRKSCGSPLHAKWDCNCQRIFQWRPLKNKNTRFPSRCRRSNTLNQIGIQDIIFGYEISIKITFEMAW